MNEWKEQSLIEVHSYSVWKNHRSAAIRSLWLVVVVNMPVADVDELSDDAQFQCSPKRPKTEKQVKPEEEQVEEPLAPKAKPKKKKTIEEAKEDKEEEKAEGLQVETKAKAKAKAKTQPKAKGKAKAKSATKKDVAETKKEEKTKGEGQAAVKSKQVKMKRPAACEASPEEPEPAATPPVAAEKHVVKGYKCFYKRDCVWGVSTVVDGGKKHEILRAPSLELNVSFYKKWQQVEVTVVIWKSMRLIWIRTKIIPSWTSL